MQNIHDCVQCNQDLYYEEFFKECNERQNVDVGKIAQERQPAFGGTVTRKKVKAVKTS